MRTSLYGLHLPTHMLAIESSEVENVRILDDVLLHIGYPLATLAFGRIALVIPLLLRHNDPPRTFDCRIETASKAPREGGGALFQSNSPPAWSPRCTLASCALEARCHNVVATYTYIIYCMRIYMVILVSRKYSTSITI